MPGEFAPSLSSRTAAIAWGDFFATVSITTENELHLVVCVAPVGTDDLLKCWQNNSLISGQFLGSPAPIGTFSISFGEHGTDPNCVLVTLPDAEGWGLWLINATGASVEVEPERRKIASFPSSEVSGSVSTAILASTESPSRVLAFLVAPTEPKLIVSSLSASIIVQIRRQLNDCSSLETDQTDSSMGQVRIVKCLVEQQETLIAIDMSNGDFRLFNLSQETRLWTPGNNFVVLQPSNAANGDILLSKLSGNISTSDLSMLNMSALLQERFQPGDRVEGVLLTPSGEILICMGSTVVVSVSYNSSSPTVPFSAAVLFNMTSTTLEQPRLFNSSLWFLASDGTNITLMNAALNPSSAPSAQLSMSVANWHAPGTLMVLSQGSALFWLASPTSRLLVANDTIVSEAFSIGSLEWATLTPCSKSAETAIFWSRDTIYAFSAVQRSLQSIAVSEGNAAWIGCSPLRGSRDATAFWTASQVFYVDSSAASNESLVGPIKLSRGPFQAQWGLGLAPPVLLYELSAARLAISLSLPHQPRAENQVSLVRSRCSSDSHCPAQFFCHSSTKLCIAQQAPLDANSPAPLTPSRAPLAPPPCLSVRPPGNFVRFPLRFLFRVPSNSCP